MNLKKSGLWIHVDKARPPFCVFLGPYGCKNLPGVVWSPKELSAHMLSANVDFLVFDGYKSTLQYKDCLSFLFP
jgi:hypothetical protein